MGTITQTMHYQIIKPVHPEDINWKVFDKILKELTIETRRVLNKTIQLAWEYHGFASDYKILYGVTPKKTDILKYTDVFGYAYDRLKDEYYKMSRSNLSQTIQRATKKWKSDLKDIVKGEKSIVWYRNSPIDIVSKAIKIYKEDNNYYLEATLISPQYKKEIGISDTKIKLLLKVGDKSQQTILDRIISNEYHVSASQILKKKDKWFFSLSYSFEVKPKELDKNNIMGIDMGINYPVYIAFNHCDKRYKIEGGEIENFRKQIERRKRELQVQSKYCGNGRIGHGYYTRMKPVNKIGNKISNFRKLINHKYSRYVVDLAIKHNCGVIQMEKLEGISKDDSFLKNWTYYDLQQKIKYKAEAAGIEVRFVDPKYTSQRCSKCGYIAKENRPKKSDWAEFRCVKCGFTTNADYNAALNIATPNIEEIIKEQLKVQKTEKQISTKSA